MNIKISLILVLFLFSCKKEVNQVAEPKCNCYERHEVKTPVQGGFNFLLDYNTTAIEDLCSKETGQWIYYGSVSQYRYKVICD